MSVDPTPRCLAEQAATISQRDPVRVPLKLGVGVKELLEQDA